MRKVFGLFLRWPKRIPISLVRLTRLRVAKEGNHCTIISLLPAQPQFDTNKKKKKT